VCILCIYVYTYIIHIYTRAYTLIIYSLPTATAETFFGLTNDEHENDDRRTLQTRASRKSDITANRSSRQYNIIIFNTWYRRSREISELLRRSTHTYTIHATHDFLSVLTVEVFASRKTAKLLLYTRLLWYYCYLLRSRVVRCSSGGLWRIMRVCITSER